MGTIIKKKGPAVGVPWGRPIGVLKKKSWSILLVERSSGCDMIASHLFICRDPFVLKMDLFRKLVGNPLFNTMVPLKTAFKKTKGKEPYVGTSRCWNP